ncbi:chemotaxis protein CheA [Rubellimicrobium rubrum]|uniref:Chemotaxis protein CheA n=1 Tax=Rubellimicrobium rubrum TaxID=2585369 RepID=A0A5C4MHW5_9RHOB|nr:chemotaxis protein CheA [Rubellimicrobium rubrum]TNC43144.1 chemotaxis protein CheA [Rubellimicrobium rubrum]
MIDNETLALFRAEAEGLVESLQSSLLAMQDASMDRSLVNQVFRDLHTLKGTGGMFGQTELASFVHHLESALEPLRSENRPASSTVVTAGLKAHDHIDALLRGQRPDGGDDILRQIAQAMTGPSLTNDWLLTFALPSDTLKLGGKPELVLDELRSLGASRIQACISRIPGLEALDPAVLSLSWTVHLPAHVAEADIHDVFMFHDGLALTLERIATKDTAAEREAASTGTDNHNVPTDEPSTAASISSTDSDKPVVAKPAAMMRVAAGRLDEMMDRVGELVIAEARLSAIAASSGDPALLAVAEEIQGLATGLRDTTMSVRMTPLGSITGRFRRLIHDLSADLGKPVDLLIEGEDTELDKTVVEQLVDPLLHLMRNAIDHGIEPAAIRKQTGKPLTGRVTLSARYSGAEVQISVVDDGYGLDVQKIRAKAIQKGLVDPSNDLSDSETFQLIFAPGFSTASAVTELSGRGVGMDVVKRTVSDLRGSIEVRSEKGQGTRIILRLPLTLAIIDGLLVEVAGERFTIPLAAVHEIVELRDPTMQEEGTAQFLNIRDRLVPYIMLRHLFTSTGEPDPYQKVVVVAAGEARIGLLVDRIIGSFQTVIKQLSPLHATMKIFSGATILGDGTVALILDVSQIVSWAQVDGSQANSRASWELVA